MKRYNKQWVFIRRQRRQYRQYIKYAVILGLLITSLIGFLLLIRPLISETKKQATSLISLLKRSSACNCSKSSLVALDHGECFFGLPVCYPGFTGDRCERKLQNEAYRSHCPPDIHHTQWTDSLIEQTKRNCLNSSIAQQTWKLSSCLFLCFYHRLTGITQVPSLLWQRSLTNELGYWIDNPTVIDDRLYEHVEGFDVYKAVPSLLHSIIEIGAGPFTQVQYLLTPFRSIKQITLVEPNALQYMKLNNCAYRGGYLRGHPVLIRPESVEDIIQRRRKNTSMSYIPTAYSALISINVVEHVRDALEYFRALYDLLENDGLLIFHERWYDYPQQGDCVLQSPEYLHPIRLTKSVIDQFLNHFEIAYINYNRTKRQLSSPCIEKSIYFIGRKKTKKPDKYIFMFSSSLINHQRTRAYQNHVLIQNALLHRGQSTQPMIVSGLLQTPAKPSQNYSCVSGRNCSRHR